MRLTTVLLIATMMQVCAASYAQKISLKEKNAPLEKIFNQIRLQSGYDFLFNKNLLKNAKPVDIDIKDALLDEVLKLCFANQPFTYTLEEKTIVVKEKEPSFLEGLAERWAIIDVRGVVRNEKGEAVDGVTVSVKGTNKGTTTNAKGEFLLKGISEDAMVVFSGVSIETYEVKVRGKKELDVNVRTRQVQLEEVDVAYNTGYQKIPKERATGSFSLIDQKTLNNTVSSNILERLEATASGVYVDRQRPAPLKIRGQSTLYETNSKPLIILDNFPYEGDVNSINPNDIANVVVLKDAAAASIWGSRAANGVIVISTKNGKYNSKTTVNFNSNVTASAKPTILDLPNMTVSDYVEWERILFDQGMYNSIINSPSKIAYSPVVDILVQKKNNFITQEEANKRLADISNQTDIRNDYLNYVYRKPIIQRYSLGVSGGGNNINYYLSAGYDKNLQNIRGNSDDRITLNFQNNFSFNKNIEISAGISYSQPRNVQKTNLSLIQYPYEKLKDARGNSLAVTRDFQTSLISQAESDGLLDWRYIPLDEIGKSNDIATKINYRINTGIKYTAFKVYIMMNLVTPFRGKLYTPLAAMSGSECYYSQAKYN